MITTTKHELRINRSPEGTHVRCTCGWAGPSPRHPESALEAYLTHRDDVDDPIFTDGAA